MVPMNSSLALQPHQLRIVDVFRYEHGSPALDAKLAQYAPDESLSSRFLIKMEIARLAKPCNRIIDFRDIQADWKLFEFNGVRHYLNEASNEDFIEIVKSYKGYTIGAYELIMKKAHEKQRNNITNPHSVNVPDVNYTSLTRFYQRKEQRLYFVSAIEVYVADPSEALPAQQKKFAIAGSTTDISPQGMCIKLSGIQVSKYTKAIYIRFIGLEKDFQFPPSVFIKYDILSISSKQANHYYRIRVQPEQSGENIHNFQKKLSKFIISQLRRHRVPIENTQEAVIVKAHEQFVIGKLDSLPVFLQCENGEWKPNALYLTEYNESIMQRLIDENHVSMLNDFVHQNDLQAALLDGGRFVHYYLLAPVSSPDGFAKFICMSLQQCMRDEEAKAIAQLAYLKSKGNLMLYRIDGMTIHPDQECHITSSLPDSSGEVFQLINQSPVERARLLASGYQRMITISDLSDLITTLDLFAEPLNENIPKNKIFQFIQKCATSKPELHIVKSEVDDKRQEDRFLYKMPIKIYTPKNPKVKIDALTIDISTKGLKIKTASNLSLFFGESIFIDFPEMRNKSGEPVTHQHYTVIRAHNNILNLTIHGEALRHEARQQIKEFINKNLNSLTATGCRDVIYGLPRAVRNLFSFNHQYPVIFIQRHEKTRYISDMALSNNSIMPEISINEDENSAITMAIIKHEAFAEMLNNAWGNLKEQHDVSVFNFLVTVKEKSSNAGYYIIIKNLDDLIKNRQMKDAIQQSSFIGETRLLRVAVTPKGKVFNKYFKDELAYLTRYAPNRAKLVLDQVNNIDAIGSVSDITDAISDFY